MVKKKKKINIKLKKLNNRDREAMDDQKIFINYFREKINFINGLKIEKNARIFKKIIYVSILDALSKTIYPNYSNRKRFVLFIEEFSGWKYSSKVSIPHFIKMLKLAPEPEFSKLREYVYLIYESWKKGDVITLDKDIDIQKIYKFWPNNSEKKIRGIKTESLKHRDRKSVV